MGQYYKFINVDKREICDRNLGMMKLMEHSYLYNNYCSDILFLLNTDWKNDRVIHVGDYAEPDDGTTTQEIIEQIQDELKVESVYNEADNYLEKQINEEILEIRYVYNHDKKEYVDLYKQPIQYFDIEGSTISVTKINSFALLVACGNGLGGGDYVYHAKINEEKVGSWAGDRFESSTTFLDKYKEYTENSLMFNEIEKYKGISNWNEQTKSQILNDSGELLVKELKNIEEEWYRRIDLNKLKLSKEGLFNDEYNFLKSILERSKSKQNLLENTDLELEH